MSACFLKICKKPGDYNFITCCGDCKQRFHSSCVNADSMPYKEKRNWKCEDCRVKKATNSAQPTDTTSQTKPESLRSDSSFEFAFQDSKFRRPNDVLQSTERESNGLSEAEREVNRTESFDYLSTQYNELSQKLTNIEEQVKFHIEKFKKYTGDVTETKGTLYVLGQTVRDKSIEIHGLELPNNLDCTIKREIVELSKGFHIREFSEEDIDIVYLLPAKNGLPRPIVVQFKSRSMRNMWMSKRKTKIDYDAWPRGSGSKSRIYINENLGSYFRRLLYEARTLAKNNGYKFVWFKYGKLYIKKNETSATTRIRSKEDLDKFVMVAKKV